jgi:hypothetical protein
MATAILGNVNTFEAKLKAGGLTEPVTTYLADPLDAAKLASGWTAIVTSANAGALATAYPPASYPGLFANVGAAAPYALYYSTGVLWKVVTIV